MPTVFPEIFSLLDDPEKALETLSDFARYCLHAKSQNLLVDQSRCKVLDYGAQAIANLLLEDAVRAGHNAQSLPPQPQDVRELLAATGFKRHIQGTTAAMPLGYSVFSLKRGSATNRTEGVCDRDHQVVALAEYFNSCLRRVGYSLTPHGEGHLGRMLSEILINAEEHSKHREWWIGAYMKAQPEAVTVHIVIINFGVSIEASLSEGLRRNPRLRSRIEELEQLHSKSGLFSKGWHRRTLRTLYALQEGVSSVFGKEQVRRGVGTIHMIDFFHKLTDFGGDQSSRMCIVSGDSFILFNGDYQLLPATGTAEGLRIAFNASNDLSQPPSRQHVRTLNHYFPGTIISMRFLLSRRHLATLLA